MQPLVFSNLLKWHIHYTNIMRYSHVIYSGGGAIFGYTLDCHGILEATSIKMRHRPTSVRLSLISEAHMVPV